MTPVTKPQLLAWLKAQGACAEALRWARKQRSARAILATERTDWLEWLASRVDAEWRAKRATLNAEYRAKLDTLARAKLDTLARASVTMERVTRAVRKGI